MKAESLNANQKVLLLAYKTYLANIQIFEEIEQVFKDHNTTTKIELYKRAVESVSLNPEYDKMKTGDAFVDNAIAFLETQFDLAKNRIYKLTANAVANIDDPGFLNDIQ